MPQDSSIRLVLAVVGVGTLLSAMTGSTVTVALPAIGQDLGVSIEWTSWVMLSYLLSVTVLLPVCGWAGDRMGHRAVYLGGFGVFGLASLAAGLAPGFAWLIAARVMQGAGGAMVMSTGPALLTTTVPGARRGMALGIVATATYTGLTVGPSLGGALVGLGGWRWVLLVNTPVAAIVWFMGWRGLPRAAERRPMPFDGLGALTLFVGLPLLLIAMSRGGRWGWTAAPTLSLATLGVAAVALFIAVELRRDHPLLQLRLFYARVFAGATLSAVANYIAIFIQMILLPFYLMEGLNLSAPLAGMVLSAQPLAMALVAMPSGTLSDRVGTRGLAVLGLLIQAGGMVGLSTLSAESTATQAALWQAMLGLGTGVFISPNSSALMGAAPRHQQGMAGGVLALARSMGMMLGVASATAVFAAAGGVTGGAWGQTNYDAMSLAFLVGAAVSLFGAVSAALRGPRPSGTGAGCATSS